MRRRAVGGASDSAAESGRLRVGPALALIRVAALAVRAPSRFVIICQFAVVETLRGRIGSLGSLVPGGVRSPSFHMLLVWILQPRFRVEYLRQRKS